MRNHRHSRGRRRRPVNHWRVLPRTALGIFAATVILTRTGAADKLEALVDQWAQNEGLSSALLAMAMPGGTDEALPASAPDTPDEPAPVPDEDENTDADSLPAQIEMAESPPPEVIADLPPADVASVTIDGKDDGYPGSGSIYIQNRSKYDIDIPALLKADDGVQLSGDDVQVLIMHTHGSEAYTPDPFNNYTPTDTDRTTDTNYNVVRVGDEIADILESRGIKTVHSRTLHDSPAYNGSYNRALEDITAYIKKYPSIKVVIDVHRDAMVTQNGTKYKTVAEVNGETTAQLMFVCGTDGGGLVHDSWRKNLSFQMKLQDRLNTEYPGLMRPINIRDERFNQHVTLGSMLLEVGTSGNSLPEALSSARLFANALADELLSR